MYYFAVVFESHPVLVLCGEFTENSIVFMSVCAHSQFSCFKKKLLGPPLPKIEAHGLPFALLPPLQVIH
jgi:hypothetical protein